MDEKLVSVCLLAYNHEKYIGDCLESIMNQTYRNIELLIMDDCSKDKTSQLIRKEMKTLQSVFVRVVYFENEKNVGNISANANKLIERAEGDYIKCFAGDDLMTPECVEQLVWYLEENSDKAMCYSNAYIIDDYYRYGRRAPNKLYLVRFRPPIDKRTTFLALLERCFIPATTVMIRREMFAKYGMFDEDVQYEDYDFWLRLSRYEEFGYIPKNLVLYRRAAESVSNIRKWHDRKKLIFILQGVVKVNKKYLQYVSKSERRYYVKKFYADYIKVAYKKRYFDVMLRLMCRAISKKYYSLRDMIELIKTVQ